MASVEVLAGPETSPVERRAEAGDCSGGVRAGAVVRDVARQADVTPSLIYRWRRDLRAAANGFAQGLWRGLAMASPYRLCRRSRSNSRATPRADPGFGVARFAAAVVEALARR